jgi:hypothetical protein
MPFVGKKQLFVERTNAPERDGRIIVTDKVKT